MRQGVALFSTRASHSTTAPTNTTGLCILKCIDTVTYQRRPTLKDSTLCRVCTDRIAEQAKRVKADPKWLERRKTQVLSWIGGMDYLIDHPQQRSSKR